MRPTNIIYNNSIATFCSTSSLAKHQCTSVIRYVNTDHQYVQGGLVKAREGIDNILYSNLDPFGLSDKVAEILRLDPNFGPLSVSELELYSAKADKSNCGIITARLIVISKDEASIYKLIQKFSDFTCRYSSHSFPNITSIGGKNLLDS